MANELKATATTTKTSSPSAPSPSASSSFFRAFNPKNHDHLIKSIIFNNLSENVKELQFDFKENGVDQLGLSDVTNSLCTIIEAIFLHGLKSTSVFRQTLIEIVTGPGLRDGDDGGGGGGGDGGDRHRYNNRIGDRIPQPNFWAPLMIISHKETIKQIQSLSQITSEIGCCRAWIRSTLADTILSAYFQSIRKNGSAIKRYYKTEALVRDPNLLELCEKLLIGIESLIVIKLPLNSSLLNQWTIHPLQMAGIYTPTYVRSCPIISGVDVVQTIDGDDDGDAGDDGDAENADELTEETITGEVTTGMVAAAAAAAAGSSTNSATATHSATKTKEMIENLNVIHQKYTKNYDLTEDEYLKILLNRCDEMEIDNKNKNNKNKDADADANDEKIGQSTTDEGMNLLLNHQLNVHGNSIITKMNWSTERMNDRENSNSLAGDPDISDDQDLNESFNNLLEKYNENRNLHHQKMSIDMENIWDTFEKSTELLINDCKIGGGGGGESGDRDGEKGGGDCDEMAATDAFTAATDAFTAATDNDDHDDDDDENNNQDDFDFEILTKEFLNISGQFTIKELRQNVEQLCKIPQEMGLLAQNYVCYSCPNPLGIGFTIAHVCAFDGHYFCENCMHAEQFAMPARILYNWDFRRWAVSKKNGAFLLAIQYQPFLDVNLLNPAIYGAVDEMKTIRRLRQQLNFIRGYLFTCSAVTIERFQKLMYTKEHLYEYVDRYSVADLIHGLSRGGGGGGGGGSGGLCQQLQKAVHFGRDHILHNCQLCSKKGFICEMCTDLNAVYPFDIDRTYRCDGCGAVFHKNCLNSMVPCPKCERKRKREDLPLLDAVYSRSPSPPVSPPVVILSSASSASTQKLPSSSSSSS